VEVAEAGGLALLGGKRLGFKKPIEQIGPYCCANRQNPPNGYRDCNVPRRSCLRDAIGVVVETAAALRDAIGVVVEAGQRQVVMDLDAVDFLDSAGLGVLIGAMTLVRAHGGSFGVVCRWDRTLNLLRITGVDQALEVHPNLAAMMASRPR
jgi:anti-sigma B factor antagonist